MFFTILSFDDVSGPADLPDRQAPGSASPPVRVGSGGCGAVAIAAAREETRGDLDDEPEHEPADEGGNEGESVENRPGLLEGGDELAREERADSGRDRVGEPFEAGPSLADQLHRNAEDQRPGDEDDPATESERNRPFHDGPPFMGSGCVHPVADARASDRVGWTNARCRLDRSTSPVAGWRS